MRVFGGSINLMSMGGLAVAIGLVIDDAVVVVENIHRRAAEGASSVVDCGVGAHGAARQLDAHDRRRVRAARPALGRGGPVLPRALAEPVGRGAALAGAVGDASCRCWRAGRFATIAATARVTWRTAASTAWYGRGLDADARAGRSWPSLSAVVLAAGDRLRCSARSAPASCRPRTRADSSSTT